MVLPFSRLACLTALRGLEVAGRLTQIVDEVGAGAASGETLKLTIRQPIRCVSAPQIADDNRPRHTFSDKLVNIVVTQDPMVGDLGVSFLVHAHCLQLVENLGPVTLPGRDTRVECAQRES